MIYAFVHLLFFIVPKFRLVVGFYYPMHLNSGELTARRRPCEKKKAEWQL